MLHRIVLPVLAVGASLLAGAPALAETIAQALAAAYSYNPEINSARAGTRATDEGVPIARSGNRPTISAVGTVSGVHTDVLGQSEFLRSGSLGVEITQNLFRGFRTRNAIRGAQTDVLASRELLINTVQNTLFDAAQAYMDVLRDTAILDIRRRNVSFLQEQVRAANDRFNVGENTRTDVSQTRARLAVAQSDVALADSNLKISRSIYRQIIGHDPANLRADFPYARLVPAELTHAIEASQSQHPAIRAAIFQTDSAAFDVKEIEGELLPTVSLSGAVERDYDFNESDSTPSASIVGRVSIPLYQGGAVAARVRQAKELLGQRQIEIDLTRDQVRASVVAAWSQVEAAREAIEAAGSGIESADIVLSGVQEEQRVGQRTTLDVLNAQQELLQAREVLILAQRNRVVANFALLASMGRLTAEQLSLGVEIYHPEQHYQAVADKWSGLRTPDGR